MPIKKNQPQRGEQYQTGPKPQRKVDQNQRNQRDPNRLGPQAERDPNRERPEERDEREKREPHRSS